MQFGVYVARFVYPYYFPVARARTSDFSGTICGRFKNLSDEIIRINKLVATFSNNYSSAHSILTDTQVHHHTIVDITPNGRSLISNRSFVYTDAHVRCTNPQAQQTIVDATTMVDIPPKLNKRLCQPLRRWI